MKRIQSLSSSNRVKIRLLPLRFATIQSRYDLKLEPKLGQS